MSREAQRVDILRHGNPIFVGAALIRTDVVCVVSVDKQGRRLSDVRHRHPIANERRSGERPHGKLLMPHMCKVKCPRETHRKHTEARADFFTDSRQSRQAIWNLRPQISKGLQKNTGGQGREAEEITQGLGHDEPEEVIFDILLGNIQTVLLASAQADACPTLHAAQHCSRRAAEKGIASASITNESERSVFL